MDKKQILNLLTQEIAIKRSNAEVKALNNLHKALENNGFKTLYKKEKDLIFNIGKLKAFNKNVSKEIKELTEVQKKTDNELALIGLTRKDLYPVYECTQCQDIGYINGNLCDCLKSKLIQHLIIEFGSKRNNLHSFETFDANIAGSEEHKYKLIKIKNMLKKIASKYPSSNCPNFIILSGNVGVGKTFLAECFANELINNGHLVLFISSFKMNNMFLSYHSSFDQNKEDGLDTLLSADVLIIDDLGTEPILKNVTIEYLYLIISERSEANKLTVFTTNLWVDKILERYNDRIFSRLCDGNKSFITLINGSDLRAKQREFF